METLSTEAYSEPSLTSKIELFAKIVNGFLFPQKASSLCSTWFWIRLWSRQCSVHYLNNTIHLSWWEVKRITWWKNYFSPTWIISFLFSHDLFKRKLFFSFLIPAIFPFSTLNEKLEVEIRLSLRFLSFDYTKKSWTKRVFTRKNTDIEL